MTAAAQGTPPSATRRGGVVRASALMAVAALTSRITGLVAKIVLLAVLGLSVSDSYWLANTLPNIVFELLIGGVLTSVAIPLLARAQRSDADGGLAYTQQLLTLAIVALSIATALAVAAAPLLTGIYLSDDFHGDPRLATMLAYLLLPQILFYGLSALFGAILNTKERFAGPAWAPVLNNLVVIGISIYLAFTAGGLNETVTGQGGDVRYGAPTTSQILVLGIGTTAGIVLQALVLIPSLRRAGFHFRWRLRWDHRMTEAGGLAGWAVAYVLVSQVGYVVATNLASGPEGGITTFNFASLLFQTPYGILGVSVLTAIMPRMSRHAAAGEMELVKDDMSLANRLSAVALLPVSAGILALAGAVGVAAAGYGKVSVDSALLVGVTFAGLAVGLVPLAMTLVQMRVFYAMKDGRTPVLINAIMVGVRVPLLFVATTVSPEMLIPGLAVATAVSYLVGAVVGELWLRQRFGPMGTRRTLRTIAQMTLVSAVGGLAAWGVVQWGWGGFPDSLPEALMQCAAGGLVGVIVVVVGALLLRVEEFAPLWRRLAPVARRLRPGGRAAGTVTHTGTDDSDPRREQVNPSVSGETSTSSTPEATGTMAPSPEITDVESAAVGPADRADAGSTEAASTAAASTEAASTEAASTEAASTEAASTAPAKPTWSRDGGSTADETVQTSAVPRAAGATIPTTSIGPGAMVGGRYRLVSLVAVDAFGNRFWRAKDTVLPRDMAVTLLPEGPNTNATVTRTLRAGRLHHIGLPQTLDLGTEAGHSYVVGQWVDGATLTDLLAGGPLDGEVASSITAKVADAIAEAHRNGISLGAIHPSLVRVNFDGQVRLSHVISYPSSTAEQDIRAIGGLLYLMLTATYPLPQNGMSPPLPVAPMSGGEELPADQAHPRTPAGLSALAERTLHPDGQHGVRSAAAIASLLHSGDPLPAEPTPAEQPALTAAQLSERRLMRERRAKLGVAGVMLLALTVLVAIVIGSLIKRVVDSVQDPIITSDQRLDVTQQTLAATSGGVAPTGDATAGPGTSAVPVASGPEVPVTIVGGEVYDPQGEGTKDYTSYVDRAYDPDPTTAWQTFAYKQQFGPGGIKTGVGLLLTFDREVQPRTVTVTTTTPGIKVEVRASDGNVNASVTETQVLATSDVGTAPAAIAIPGAPTSKYLIVFVTGLVGSGTNWEGAISNIAVTTAG